MSSAPHTPLPEDNDAGEAVAQARLALAMIATLSADGRRELLRVLRVSLAADALTVSQQRVVEFGPLAAMLDERAAELGITPPARRGQQPNYPTRPGRWITEPYPLVRMGEYDQTRPVGALTGRQITDMFGGSWRLACRSVWGLRVDGRYAGLGQPWRNVISGRPGIRYTDDECLDAIRACARHLCRVPTSTRYIAWVNQRKAIARARGQRLRLPGYEPIRLRWRGWPRAIAAAAIRPADLRADTTPNTGPVSGPVLLDGAAIRRRRADRGLRDADLRRAVGMPLSTWRGALAGTTPVGVSVAATLATMLDLAITDVVWAHSP